MTATMQIQDPEESNEETRFNYLAELFQTSLTVLDIFGPLLDQAEAMFQHVPVGFQPRV